MMQYVRSWVETQFSEGQTERWLDGEARLIGIFGSDLEVRGWHLSGYVDPSGSVRRGKIQYRVFFEDGYQTRQDPDGYILCHLEVWHTDRDLKKVTNTVIAYEGVNAPKALNRQLRAAVRLLNWREWKLRQAKAEVNKMAPSVKGQ